MKFQSSALLVAVLGSVTSAVTFDAVASSSVTSSIEIKCFTSYNKVSQALIGTSTHTHTGTHTTTILLTVTPTSTVIPDAVTMWDTEWDTATVTTRVPFGTVCYKPTHTITEWSTDSSTTTLDTSTAIITNTITGYTTTTSTSTIAAPPSYTPIESSLPGSSEVEGESRRDAGHAKLFARHKPAYYHAGQGNKGYAQSVSCMQHDIVETLRHSTSTASTTATITGTTPTAYSTTTSTTTVPAYTFSGSGAPVYSTVTSTTTSVSTYAPSTTFTTSTTSTQTSIVQATAYAQCGSDNFVNQVSGHPIVGASDPNGATFWRSTISSPEACCVMAAQTFPGLGAALLWNPKFGGVCAIDPSPSCPAITAYLGKIGTSDATIAMNGQCGGFQSSVIGPVPVSGGQAVVQ